MLLLANTLKIEHISKYPVMGAVYTVDEDGEIVPLEFTEIAERVMPAVVHIKSTQTYKISGPRAYQYKSVPDPFRDFFDDDFFDKYFGPRFKYEYPDQKGDPQVRVGTASGVIINDDGYIITNNHVIENADDIEVTLHDKRTYKATVVGYDPSTDLALLQIKEEDLPYLAIVNSDNVRVGEWVMAVGNPFNLNSTVTAGIVSARARNINILRHQSAIESFIQTDAAINPGNSGGPLINIHGEVIGINTAIYAPTGIFTGVGFAIPVNKATQLLKQVYWQD